MHKQHPNHETDVTRRQALQTIAMLPIQMYGLTAFASQYGTRPLPEEVLPLCAAGLTSCWELRQYEPEGMQAVKRLLSAYLPTLESITRQSSTSTSFQREAAGLAAQGYLLAWRLAEYTGNSNQMKAVARLARFYAQLAHDINLEVAALTRLAVAFDFEKRDMQSLETYQEALDLPGFQQVSPLLQGRVYVGLAATHAYCGQTPQALSFLSHAQEIYPECPEADPGYGLDGSAGSQGFAVWEGLVLKHTNRLSDAIETFSRFGNLTPKPGLLESLRIEYLSYTASVAVKQRNLEMACFYLDAAEEVAWNIRHEQRYTEVRETFRDVRLLWPSEPKVKTLQEKLYARQW